MHTQNKHVTNNENASEKKDSKVNTAPRLVWNIKLIQLTQKRRPFIKHNIKNSEKSSSRAIDDGEEGWETRVGTRQELTMNSLDFQWWLKLLTASSNTSEGRSYWLCRYEWSYATHQARSVGRIKNFLVSLNAEKVFCHYFLFISSLKIANEWIRMGERLEALGVMC